MATITGMVVRILQDTNTTKRVVAVAVVDPGAWARRLWR